jgi:hypothetical protein
MTEHGPSLRTHFDDEDLELIVAACQTKMKHHEWKADNLNTPDRNIEVVMRHRNKARKLKGIIDIIIVESI